MLNNLKAVEGRVLDQYEFMSWQNIVAAVLTLQNLKKASMFLEKTHKKIYIFWTFSVGYK